ncbi:hypothetical protein KC19_9G076500 [Ceratodon purpureus]|uniref:Phytocyanin domain-containing protein n=1 Tax=Ceratodon purpureus TaxID=3225 RepID=A0A8T0GT55_CERPU|nr:hypothetical protein KC19_9G076500 [Ceratodon purpureus]
MIPRLYVASRPSKARALAQVVLVLAACVEMGLIHHVQCANYTVGSGFTDTNAGIGMNYTWTNTVNGLVRPDVLEAAYQQWANSVNVTAGDTLIFDYLRGAHTVFLAKTELAYANCDFSAGSLETIPDAVPATYTVKPTDVELFFTCTVPGHCAGGQKVKIAPFGTTSATPTTPQGSNAPQHSTLSTGTIAMLLFVCYFSLFTQHP